MSPASTPQGWVLGRINGAPVVVSPTSLLLGVLIAGSWYPLVSETLRGHGVPVVLGTVAATVVGVGVSVMIHELFHGLAGTILGRRPILYELYLWGGRTSFGPSRTWTAWKDAVTSLAGPFANVLLWLAARWLLRTEMVSSVPVYIVVWALAWVNLALAVFNALPGLPLDGGHALAALVAQVTGRPEAGRKVAAVGGLLVVGVVVWHWMLEPLVLHGTRPNSMSLILAVLVVWPIAQSSWDGLGLAGRERAAARVDLRAVAQPVAVVASGTSLTEVRSLLRNHALVIVLEEGRLVGTIDAASLSGLGVLDEDKVTAVQVCTVLPAEAIATQVDGVEAVQALRRARELSRWLVLVEAGQTIGAVPTGAR